MNGFVSINAKAGLLLPIAALLLQGCLSTLVTKPISESSRDTSGTFDGQWAGTIESTAGQQYGPGNWTFTCDDRSGDRFGPISVKDGKATMPMADKMNETFVNSEGQFRFEVPIDTEATAGGTSDSSINDGAITLILIGSLSSQTGSFTIGIAQFANDGCTSAVSYETVASN